MIDSYHCRKNWTFCNNRYFFQASLVGFEPAWYIASQNPNVLPTELFGPIKVMFHGMSCSANVRALFDNLMHGVKVGTQCPQWYGTTKIV